MFFFLIELLCSILISTERLFSLFELNLSEREIERARRQDETTKNNIPVHMCKSMNDERMKILRKYIHTSTILRMLDERLGQIHCSRKLLNWKL